jgi:predicted transcriptional regulator YheO
VTARPAPDEPAPTPAWVRAAQTTCEAIATLLHPHAEVALHDLATDRIVGLWNPISGRRVGDPALLDELPASWRERPVQGPYRKVLADGRELSAVSAVVPDARGRPRGLLCVNLDRGPLLGAVALLGAFAAPVEAAPPELVDRDWREQIALVVDDRCRARDLPRDRLTREDRRDLVRALEERGLFATRNAAEHAGRALGVSRATVYTLLKEIRRDDRTADVPS